MVSRNCSLRFPWRKVPRPMDLQSYLTEVNTLVDRALDRWLPGQKLKPGIIHQAMRYSVFAGGKRLRPVLTIAASESVGGTQGKALPAACALELVHTYSLIHDDLPAMDDDDFRRGRPSSHKVYGEAVAILAGDALLTYAFELLVRESLNLGSDAGLVSSQVQELAQAAGTAGMIGGQVLDLEAEGRKVDLAGLEEIHHRKTGALLKAAVRLGAIAAGAGWEELTDLTAYAEALGLAFQIKDDLLDVEGDSAKLGKPVGSDAAKDKSTYPSIIGLEQSKLMLAEQTETALKLAGHFGDKGRILAELALFVRDREF